LVPDAAIAWRTRKAEALGQYRHGNACIDLQPLNYPSVDRIKLKDMAHLQSKVIIFITSWSR